MSLAASGSWAVARIALPARVEPMNQVVANTSGIITAKATRYPRKIGTPPMVNTARCAPMRSATDCGLPPRQSRPTFCRMKENPTAVISGASLGAFRSGR